MEQGPIPNALRLFQAKPVHMDTNANGSKMPAYVKLTSMLENLPPCALALPAFKRSTKTLLSCPCTTFYKFAQPLGSSSCSERAPQRHCHLFFSFCLSCLLACFLYCCLTVSLSLSLSPLSFSLCAGLALLLAQRGAPNVVGGFAFLCLSLASVFHIILCLLDKFICYLFSSSFPLFPILSPLSFPFPFPIPFLPSPLLVAFRWNEGPVPFNSPFSVVFRS